MKNILIFFVLWLPGISTLYPQNLTEYKVSGIVIDSGSGSALQNVNIIITEKETDKMLAGMNSDLNGKFTITGIKHRTIKIKLSMIGYSEKNIETNLINGSTDLGIISLTPVSTFLDEVVIKSSIPMIEYNADKTIINIDKVLGNSASLSDALRNSGVVEVNPVTNKISLRGNSNVKILYDGKPVALSESMLSQLPASSIDKVEVSTASSAKDDPEGEAGTINIITKKGLPGKYSGSLSVTTSTQTNHYGSGIFNYRTGPVNLFSSVLGGVGQTNFNINVERTNYKNPDYHRLITNGASLSDGFLYSAKTGFDLDFDSLDFFSLYGNILRLKYNNNSTFNTEISNYLQNNLIEYDLKNREDVNYDNYLLSLYYRRDINKKGCRLTFDGLYSYLDNDFASDLVTANNYLANFPFLQNSAKHITNTTIITKTDLELPVEIGNFETGYHFTFRNRQYDYIIFDYDYLNKMWSNNLKLSNLFRYKEIINSLYAQFTKKVDQFEIKSGIRLESTNTLGNLITNAEQFKTNYLSVFPSISLSYSISDQSRLSISFSRRIERPIMEFINPFSEWQGPDKLFRGNPKLEPAYSNLFEVKFDQFVNLFYSKTSGSINMAETVINDSISMYSIINMSSTSKYGFELSIPYSNDPKYPFKLPEFITFLQVKYAWHSIKQEGHFFSENLSSLKNYWFFNSTGSFRLLFDVELTFSWLYIPKISDGRNNTNSNSFLTFNMSKNFFNKELKLSLTFNNVQKSNYFNIETFGSEFYSNLKYNNLHGSGIFLSINYSYNDFKKRDERNIDDGRDRIENKIIKE